LSQREDDPRTYTANCHCGQFKYEVKLSPPFPEHQIASCNCSICRWNGYLLAYPLRDNIKILRGEDQMAKYSFNRHKATHVFCPTCGSSVWIDFNNQEAKDVIGINVRLIKGIDLDSLKFRFVDGASHSGAY
ncbi:Mss4-like protein, partial [Thelonectria olida]